MAVTLSYTLTTTATETLTAADNPTLGAATLTHNALNSTGSLTGSTSTPVTMAAGFTKALSSGTATVDLTAITDSLGRTINMTGLKVQMIRAKASSDNANVISFKSGASSGYNLGGNANTLISLYPGDEVILLWSDDNPDVAGGAKNLDLAGTGAQEIEFLIVAG